MLIVLSGDESTVLLVLEALEEEAHVSIYYNIIRVQNRMSSLTEWNSTAYIVITLLNVNAIKSRDIRKTVAAQADTKVGNT